MSACDGRAFESELGFSCKQLTRFYHNSNNPNPCCDRTATIPVRVLGVNIILGLSMLLEAKEVRTPSLSFAAVTSTERKHLHAHFMSAGITAVVIKWVTNRPRAFFISWSDWLELEANMGFDPEHDATKGRRKAGTASFSLLDGERPFTLNELTKVTRPHSLGSCWDLMPLLPPGVELSKEWSLAS